MSAKVEKMPSIDTRNGAEHVDLEASVLGRIAKLTLAHNDDNNNTGNGEGAGGKNYDTCFDLRRDSSRSTSSSSGIGSGELSPTITTTSSSIAEKEPAKQVSNRRHSSDGSAKMVPKTEAPQPHTVSLGAQPVVNGQKKIDPTKKPFQKLQNHGGHLSPAEFIQMSRLRASALANKVNTSATFGGSKDFCSDSFTTANEVDELTKIVEKTKIYDEEKHDDQTENKKIEEEGEKDGDLIGRSPIPVYQANRHVQHPYQQQGGRYATVQPAPNNAYYRPKPNGVGSPLSPAEYVYQQRMRAGPQYQNGPLQQQQQAQYYEAGYPYQQQHLAVNGYEYCATAPDMQQQQQAVCYQAAQPAHNYSPVMSPHEMMANYGYNVQSSPMSMQCTDVTPPGSVQSYNNYASQFTPLSGSPPASSTPAHMSPVRPTEGGYSTLEAALLNNSNNQMISAYLDEFEQQAQMPTGADEAEQSFFAQDNNCARNNGNDSKVRHMADKSAEELPEALCDFILKYSRRYSTGSSASGGAQSPADGTGRRPSDGSFSGDESGNDEDSVSAVFASVNMNSNPASCQSSVDGSPAPAVATNASKYRPLKPKEPQQPHAQLEARVPAMQESNRNKPANGGKAKQRLREMIAQQDFDSAWAWAMRCCQACPGALFFRDPDGDSLLHIVVWHKDFAKIYALTEIMLKDDHLGSTKAYDLPNKLEETPLFLAVEKRMEDIVAYLLECGANPNLRARNQNGDAPLHYAAARGMSEIVQALCASPRTNYNVLNGAGMTPLLCAVKNHGVIEEESQCLVNNKPTIRSLLKAGADPKIPDVASGKSVLHFCVERMDPDLVQLFRDHLDKDSMAQLVNMADYNGDTPVHILSRTGSPRGSSNYGRGEGEEELRRKMLSTLIECGADVSQCAGGLDGENGVLLLLPSDRNSGADDLQFTIIETA